MNSSDDGKTQAGFSLPPDDLIRALTMARSNDPTLPHIGLVGDTYTILLAGKHTAGRFCLSICTFRLGAVPHRRTLGCPHFLALTISTLIRC
jgi:hypothetical protein